MTIAFSDKFGFVNVKRTHCFHLCFREKILNFMTSLDEMISLPTDLQFKLLSNRLPEAVVMAKVF